MKILIKSIMLTIESENCDPHIWKFRKCSSEKCCKYNFVHILLILNLSVDNMSTNTLNKKVH